MGYSCGLVGGVGGFDGAHVGEDIAFEETAFGAAGGDFVDFGLGDAVFVEGLRDGGRQWIFLGREYPGGCLEVFKRGM